MSSNGSRKSSDRSRGRSNFVCKGPCWKFRRGVCPYTADTCQFEHIEGEGGMYAKRSKGGTSGAGGGRKAASGAASVGDHHKAASRAGGGRRGAGGAGGGLAAASGVASTGDHHRAASRAGGDQMGSQCTLSQEQIDKVRQLAQAPSVNWDEERTQDLSAQVAHDWAKCVRWYPDAVRENLIGMTERVIRHSMVEITAQLGFKGTGGSSAYGAEKGFLEARIACPRCKNVGWKNVPDDLPTADFGCIHCGCVVEIKDLKPKNVRTTCCPVELQIPVSKSTATMPRLISERCAGVFARCREMNKWWFVPRDEVIDSIENPLPGREIRDSDKSNRKQVWVRRREDGP